MRVVEVRIEGRYSMVVMYQVVDRDGAVVGTYHQHRDAMGRAYPVRYTIPPTPRTTPQVEEGEYTPTPLEEFDF